MEDDLTPAVVRRVDYASTFRFSRLFGCFSMAITPSRLVLALLFIVSAWLGGLALDAMVWSDRVVFPDEWHQYRHLPAEGYRQWRENFPTDGPQEGRRGVFTAVLEIQQELFRNMVHAAIAFRPGFDQFSPDTPVDEQTVIGAVRLLTITLPGWLWHSYPGFVVIYAIILMALWALLGGAISRQMIVAASVDRMVPMTEAVAFAAQRWLTFVAAPLIPLGFIFLMGLALSLFGLFYWIPIVNVLFGLLYVIVLGVGSGMALLLVLWFAGVHMMYPAISAQGADALDAMARGFSYVLARPWRLFFYSLVALVYGAATYVFVGLFVYLTLALGHWGAAWWGGLDGVVEAPQFGRWPAPAVDAQGTDAGTAFFIQIWIYLAIAALAAYAISFYFAAFSQIYLLLRQQTDGDDPVDVYEPQPPQPPMPGDKVEPPAASAAPAPSAPQSAAAPDSIEDVEPAPDPSKENPPQ